MIDQIKPLIGKLTLFAKSRMGFEHPPRLFLRSDSENSQKILGKTAYYDPKQKAVTLFTHNRHPKDILRSYAHELVHHTQNLRGDLTPEKCGEMGDGYAQTCEHMREMEREAYEKGNMCFRDWEDTLSDKDSYIYIITKIAESKNLKENKKMTTKITKEFLKETIRRMISEQTYSVKPGDNLAKIARKFGSTVSAIAAANDIKNVNLINVGQKLTIPGQAPGVASAQDKADIESGRFADMLKSTVKKTTGFDPDPNKGAGKVAMGGDDVEVYSQGLEDARSMVAAKRDRMERQLAADTEAGISSPRTDRVMKRIKRLDQVLASDEALANYVKRMADSSDKFAELAAMLRGVGGDMDKMVAPTADIKEEDNAFAPSHYCIHHGGVQHEGKIVAAEAVQHNYNEELGKVTHYDMKLPDGTILENVAAEDIQVTNATLAEGHGGHKMKKDDQLEEDGKYDDGDGVEERCDYIKCDESKIQTPEQENSLYESRFAERNNKLFENLTKKWTK